MNTLAAVLATVIAVVWPVYTWYVRDTEESEYHPHVRRVREFLGERRRRYLRPVMMAVMWPFAYLYTEYVLLPILPANPVQKAFVLFIGLGLGLPVAKHLTDPNYSAFGGFRK